MTTTTSNYGWSKPDPGGSANTWGSTLNGTTDAIDQKVFDNQQGITPIGAIMMFGGGTAPANWLICDGRSLSTAAPYDKLFAVFHYAFGGSGANFNLPNLAQKFPLGVGANALGAYGGTFNNTIATGNLPVHSHTITQVAHTHTATQGAHTHPDPGHSHTVTSAGDTAQHSHGPANLMKFVGSGGTLGVGASPFNVVQGNTDPANAPGVYVNIDANTTGLQAAGADPITVVAATPSGPTATGNAGSGTAMNIVPPFVALNFIVRFT